MWMVQWVSTHWNNFYQQQISDWKIFLWFITVEVVWTGSIYPLVQALSRLLACDECEGTIWLHELYVEGNLYFDVTFL